MLRYLPVIVVCSAVIERDDLKLEWPGEHFVNRQATSSPVRNPGKAKVPEVCLGADQGSTHVFVSVRCLLRT